MFSQNIDIEINTKGCTRLVILVGRLAIKIPRFDYGWEMGLRGLLANMQEKHFSKLSDLTCPVLFSMPGGFFSVMRRCDPVSDEQWLQIRSVCPGTWLPIPVEYRKRDSFGQIAGKVFIVDFGS